MKKQDLNTKEPVIDEKDDFEFGNDTIQTGKKDDSENKKDDPGKKKEESTADDSEEGKDENQSDNQFNESDFEESDDSGNENDDGKEQDQEGKEGEDDKDDSGEEEEDKAKDEKEGDDQKDKVDEEDVDDIFAEDEKEDESDNEKPVAISYKDIANEFEIDIENDSKEEFVKKVNEKIEAAKQDVKLDDFSEQARLLVKHLHENGGDVESIFNNKTITNMQSIIALDPETKYRNVRIGELKQQGMDQEKISETIDSEISNMSTRELKDIGDKINDQARELRDKEMQKIVGDREAAVIKEKEKLEAKAAKEKNDLKSYVNKQDNFLGLKLSDKAKKAITSEIENGKFDYIVDEAPQESKFYAYMMAKYGKKIMDKISHTATEKNREGYNKATEKHKRALHNVPEKGGKSSGHSKEQVGKWDGFQNID